jgi:uncharacterized protein YhhL (DUF1145 family)
MWTFRMMGFWKRNPGFHKHKNFLISWVAVIFKTINPFLYELNKILKVLYASVWAHSFLLYNATFAKGQYDLNLKFV